MDPSRVDNDLTHLYPDFAAKIKLVLEQVNRETKGKYPGLLDVRVFEGYRSTARQEWLYQQGRTRPGEIVTNVRTPIKHGYGLAADIVGYRTNGEPDWDWPEAFWDQLGHAVRTQGLEYGGDWKSFPDTPHAQEPDSYKRQHLVSVVAYLHSKGLTTP